MFFFSRYIYLTPPRRRRRLFWQVYFHRRDLFYFSPPPYHTVPYYPPFFFPGFLNKLDFLYNNHLPSNFCVTRLFCCTLYMLTLPSSRPCSFFYMYDKKYLLVVVFVLMPILLTTTLPLVLRPCLCGLFIYCNSYY